MHKNVNNCNFLSLQFDESTTFGYTHTLQLYIFIRMMFNDTSITEKLLTIIPVQEVKNYAVQTDFPMHKLVLISTDGAPAVGCKIGLYDSM